jgi:predicted ribosomally synthesized peptide with SipW-like signal peptide
MKLKTILIAICVVIVLPTTVFAFFKDTHTSSGNTFSATTLDTEIETGYEQPIINELTYEKEVSISFALYNTGKLNTQNRISIPKITNEKFASKIQLAVILDGTETI